MSSPITESQPYDCSLLEDDDEYNVLPCMNDGPQWWQIARQVAWSFGFWFVMVVSSSTCNKIWKYWCNGTQPFWVQKYVGTIYRPARDLKVEAVLCFAQVFGSFCSVWVWVIKSYSLRGDVSNKMYWLEVLFVFLSLAHTLFERIKFSFSIKHALSFTVFLDCLTLPPIVMQRSGAWAGGSWLTLAYLRAYHCWSPIKRMTELDLFDAFLSNFVQQCILSVLECILVVFSLAGTLWIMEALGDIEGLTDQFFDSGMGDISFFQMIYFTFVTISTVGFGDYSPTTVLSRGFIIFAILGGVTFFSYMSAHVTELVEIESSGRGHYYPSKKSGKGHILVVGGGVTCGSQTVIESFMRALCRSDKYYETPDIVLMGQTSCSKEVREMLKSEWAMGYHLQYFIGIPLNSEDLIRVKASDASIVFILPDYLTNDTKTEDGVNALIAAALRRLNPNVQYRLMLCSMDSRKLTSNIGLSEFNCFSIESLKAGMLGTSHRCPGFSTLMLNLGLPDLPVPNTPFSSEIIPDSEYGQWLKEYAIGCSYEIYGFLPAPFLIGLTFKEATIKAAASSDVLILGAQIDGGIQINPSAHVISESTVLFAICRHIKVVNQFAKNNDAGIHSWAGKFRRNRKKGSFAKRHHEKFVCMKTDDEVELMYAASLGDDNSGVRNNNSDGNKSASGNNSGHNSFSESFNNISPLGDEQNDPARSLSQMIGMAEAKAADQPSRSKRPSAESLESCDEDPGEEMDNRKNNNIQQLNQLNVRKDTHNASDLFGDNKTQAQSRSDACESSFMDVGQQNNQTIRRRNSLGSPKGRSNAGIKFNGAEIPITSQKGGLDGGSGGGGVSSSGGLGSMDSGRSSLNSLSQRAVSVAKARKDSIHHNIHKIKLNSTEEDINKLRKQVKQGGHTVIIILEDHDQEDQQTTWDQLSAIVNSLIFAKDSTPLVVIHPFSAVKSRCLFMKKYASQLEKVKMFFCVGDILDPTTLQGAGCHTCTRILTLAPSAPKLERSEYDGNSLVIRSDDKKDENNILLMMLLEEYKTVWNTKNTHIIFDWYSPTAMGLLPIPKLTEHVIKRISNDKSHPLHFQLPSLNKGSRNNYNPSGSRQLSPINQPNVTDSTFETIKEKERKRRLILSKSGQEGSFDSNTSSDSSTPATSPLANNKNNIINFPPILLSHNKISPMKGSLSQQPLSPIPTSSPSPSDIQEGVGDEIPILEPQRTGFQKRSSIQEFTATFNYNSNKILRKQRSLKHKQEIKSLKHDKDSFLDDSDSDDDGEDMSEDDLNLAKVFPRANCLFAAGYSIPKSFIAALSSMAYYTPGFLEITEALLNPSEYDQKSIPFLIKIPYRFIGREYKSIANELQLEGTLPLGLLRPGGIAAGTPYPYVVTLVPTSTLILGEEDRIYILAEPLWIQNDAIKLGFVSPYYKQITKRISSVFAESPSRTPSPHSLKSKGFSFDRSASKRALEARDTDDSFNDETETRLNKEL